MSRWPTLNLIECTGREICAEPLVELPELVGLDEPRVSVEQPGAGS